MAFYAGSCPTAFALLGVRNESAGLGLHGLHSAQFTLDEAALPLGAALHAQWALDALAAFADGGGGGAAPAAARREEL